MGRRMERYHQQPKKPAKKEHRGAQHRHKSERLLRVIVFLILLALLCYPFTEPYRLETEETTVAVENLPDGLNNLKIVYITDIHAYFGAYTTQSQVNALINRINALNADIVLLGGDFASDTAGAIRFFQDSTRITARYQVAAVLGNHDRTDEAALAELQSVMVSAGVVPLVNTVRGVRIGACMLYLAGVDDQNNGFPDVTKVAEQLCETDTVIFLAHSPDSLADAYSAKGGDGSTHWFDLALCGHTHGGQVTLLGLGLFKPFTASSRYTSGWFNENRAMELVSRGVGTSVLPVRLFCLPQIHIITLTRTK